MTTILDLDNELDCTLDDTADIPDYVDPPTGAYELTVVSGDAKTYEKDGEERMRLLITYRITKTLELAQGEIAVPDNSLFSESFMWNEKGREFFKKRVKQLTGTTDVNGVSVRELLTAIEDCEVTATISWRETKNAEGTVFRNMRLNIR